MRAATDSPFQQDPPAFLLKDLTTRALEAQEYPLAGELLEQQHYLGDCPKGRQLLQVIEYKGTGLRCWTGGLRAGNWLIVKIIWAGHRNSVPSGSA